MSRVLTTAEARAFYDRFGARQDGQAFYEDAALDVLVHAGAFSDAHRVLEFGCGTGRLAERLLAHELGPEARYLGLDLSTTMVGLAKTRLDRFGPRVEVRASSGTLALDLPDGGFDRFVSTYVADLLSDADIDRMLAEAARLLAPGGRLCLANLTPGVGIASRLFTAIWGTIHAIRPSLVGGCRPVALGARLGDGRFRILCHEVVVRWAVSSEVLLAERV